MLNFRPVFHLITFNFKLGHAASLIAETQSSPVHWIARQLFHRPRILIIHNKILHSFDHPSNLKLVCKLITKPSKPLPTSYSSANWSLNCLNPKPTWYFVYKLITKLTHLVLKKLHLTRPDLKIILSESICHDNGSPEKTPGNTHPCKKENQLLTESYVWHTLHLEGHDAICYHLAYVHVITHICTHICIYLTGKDNWIGQLHVPKP